MTALTNYSVSLSSLAGEDANRYRLLVASNIKEYEEKREKKRKRNAAYRNRLKSRRNPGGGDGPDEEEDEVSPELPPREPPSAEYPYFAGQRAFDA